MKTDVVKVCIDLFSIFLFAIPLWVFNLLDAVPVVRIGYFCSDNEIRYPYHSSTVSSLVLYIVGFAFIIILSIGAETWLYRKYKGSCTHRTFHPLLVEIYRVFGYFVIGTAVNQFLTDVGKCTVGRLRPHFYDLCSPNVTCTANNTHIYIENYYCTRTFHPDIPNSKLESRLLDARKSFPSGHASFSFYSSVFAIIYLEYRMRSQSSRVVRHLVQLAMVVWAVWVSCTRISDFKHRYSDVAGGMVLGITIALFSIHLYIRSSQSAGRREKTPSEKNNLEQGLPSRAVTEMNETDA